MDYQIIISLLTLIALEVVLGIDNVIFISILANKLPAASTEKSQILWIDTGDDTTFGIIGNDRYYIKAGT